MKEETFWTGTHGVNFSTCSTKSGKGQVFWGKTFTSQQIYSVVVLAGNTQAKPLDLISLNLSFSSVNLWTDSVYHI